MLTTSPLRRLNAEMIVASLDHRRFAEVVHPRSVLSAPLGAAPTQNVEFKIPSNLWLFAPQGRHGEPISDVNKTKII